MDFHTVVIGTGFSGLGMAIQLKQDGTDDFVSWRRPHDVGGTWRDNTYPGCACDIQSHMYSFSFEQNPGWSRSFSPQPEIWDYLREVADTYGLRDHIRFGVEVTGARWDADDRRWHVTTKHGDELRRAVPRGRHRRPAHPEHPEAARHRELPRAPRSTPRSGTTTTTSPASGSRWSAPAPAPSSSCRGSRRRSRS